MYRNTINKVKIDYHSLFQDKELSKCCKYFALRIRREERLLISYFYIKSRCADDVVLEFINIYWPSLYCVISDN